MRNGVQYASITSKSCPMHDPVCAAKVAEHSHGPGEGHGHVLFPGTLVSVSILDFNGKAYLEVSRCS